MTTSFLDTAAPVRACVVSLGGPLVALDLADVREVAVFEDWTAMPLAPPHVVGVANLRGSVVPIVDAHAALGLPPRRPERRVRACVLAAAGLEAAMVIDVVVALEAFSEMEPLDRSHAPAFHHALGWVRRETGPVPLLDVPSLLQALRPAGARAAA